MARGVAADGQAHYLAGSDDQTLPWFYGLWQYARSGLPSAAERARVVDKVVKVGEALEAAAWRLPCDRMGFGHRGTFVEPNFIHAARLLFVLRALHDLSGDEFWLQRYRQRLTEPLEGTTRQALVAAGAGYGPPGGPTSYPTNPPFWISVSSHACLAALLELETDEAVAGAYREGLTRDATAALPHLALARELRADEQVFDIDWRKLNALWSPQATIAEAVALAERQVREWNRMSPRRGLEHRHLREPQFAAWLVALAGGELVRANREAMARTLTCCRWPELYTSFFTAELVYWQVGPGSWAA
ncbi:MAG: hypothetical protein HUU35_04895 [Armatimonadetes bacterium]|nr:hypothetical protein [Armatimonadota bacterium]